MTPLKYVLLLSLLESSLKGSKVVVQTAVHFDRAFFWSEMRSTSSMSEPLDLRFDEESLSESFCLALCAGTSCAPSLPARSSLLDWYVSGRCGDC